jgi:alpha-beta hydrolase superfamily lysophospholipase
LNPQAYTEDLGIYVDDTIREIEEVRRQKPNTPLIIMGHSMGGLIAVMVALKRPDLISGACLSAPCLKVTESCFLL